MCGIAGIYKINSTTTPDDLAAVRGMMNAQIHRGPDGEGFFRDERIVLGHRRLSIIDLSPAGKQPMSNEDGTIWVTYNGEIYNYQELRDELINNGHRFRSKTDTEVLVHGYEHWGIEGMLSRIRGMFSFALWDSKNQRFFAARDRMGQKPLFYFWRGSEQFGFASELKALLTLHGCPRNLDPDALLLYLQLLYVPEDWCIIKGIHKLAPAHYLVIEKGKLTTRRYWEPFQQLPEPASREEAVEECKRRMHEAIRLQLRSDVPVGVFLSGGVDSSLIALSVARQFGSPIKTITVRFPGLIDESSYAKQVAENCGSDHLELELIPSQLDKLFVEVVNAFDEPFADTSSIPTYCISAKAREHVKVILSGDGGDELFGGYGWYQEHLRATAYRSKGGGFIGRMMHQMGPSLRSMGNRFPAIRQATGRLAAKVRQEYRAQEAAGVGNVLLRHRRLVTGRLDSSCLTDELRKNISVNMDSFFLNHPDRGTDLQTVFGYDVMEYLPGDILRKVDQASMAHGLEVRSPFMDHELVEYALSIPSDWKVTLSNSKLLLKQLLTKDMPEDFVNRPKQGFGVPVADWLRSKTMKELVYDQLGDPNGRSGLWNGKRVAEAVSSFYGGQDEWAFAVWSIVWMEHWAKENQVLSGPLEQ
jgi:asparagine synthase (glutamine-hydrolysing)